MMCEGAAVVKRCWKET